MRMISFIFIFVFVFFFFFLVGSKSICLILYWVGQKNYKTQGKMKELFFIHCGKL